ncbi:MAG TPA: CU044_2847 family protein [Vicinamibacterales bacterium]|jgi:Trypsin-co-occurring domain 1|nr:CU044_2847 family protein [Vicinamibacterales bacterium]
MAVLMQFEGTDAPILIDVSPPGSGVQPAGAAETVVKHAQATFDDALRVAGSVARSFQNVLRQYELQRAELEFGFQFTGKGTVYIVQSEVQAALKVKLVVSQATAGESPSRS